MCPEITVLKTHAQRMDDQVWGALTALLPHGRDMLTLSDIADICPTVEVRHVTSCVRSLVERGAVTLDHRSSRERYYTLIVPHPRLTPTLEKVEADTKRKNRASNQTRPCLSCGTQFVSSHAGNRVCDSCKKEKDWSNPCFAGVAA